MNNFLIFAVLAFFLLGSGCNNGDNKLGECVGFYQGTLSVSRDDDPVELLNSIYNACSEADKDYLFNLLPKEFSRYKKVFNEEWELKCLRIKFVHRSFPFMYCLYDSVEMVSGEQFQREGVLFLMHDAKEWELVNFPFHASNIPEFAVKPIMISANKR